VRSSTCAVLSVAAGVPPSSLSDYFHSLRPRTRHPKFSTRGEIGLGFFQSGSNLLNAGKSIGAEKDWLWSSEVLYLPSMRINSPHNPLFFLLILALLVHTSSAQLITFEYTGSGQSYVVPNGIDRLDFELLGAGGGNALGFYTAKGGSGASISGSFAVNSGDTLFIFVGGAGSPSLVNWGDPTGTGVGGFNGGGSSTLAGAGGGGASDIRLSPFDLNSRVAVAGGGGGVGNDWAGFSADSGQSNAIPGLGTTGDYGGGGGGYLGGLNGSNFGTRTPGGQGGTSWVSTALVTGSAISTGGSAGGVNGVVRITAVPEPSTYALLAVGVIGAVCFRLKQKKA